MAILFHLCTSTCLLFNGILLFNFLLDICYGTCIHLTVYMLLYQSFIRRKLVSLLQLLRPLQWLLLVLWVMWKLPVVFVLWILCGLSTWARNWNVGSIRTGASQRRRLSPSTQSSMKLRRERKTLRLSWRNWRSILPWFVFWLTPRYSHINGITYFSFLSLFYFMYLWLYIWKFGIIIILTIYPIIMFTFFLD